MPHTMNDLLLHPIRLRIVSAMTSGKTTAKELAQALPDIPQTTLYRHINVLVDGGLLQVVKEIPQRGTVERVFGFSVPPSLSPEDLKGLQKEEYQQVFSVILTTLLQEAIVSLNSLPDDEEIDLLGEGYQFNQMHLNLTDEEYMEFNNQILSLMLKAGKNETTERKKRRIFTYLFIPVIEPPESPA